MGFADVHAVTRMTCAFVQLVSAMERVGGYEVVCAAGISGRWAAEDSTEVHQGRHSWFFIKRREREKEGKGETQSADPSAHPLDRELPSYEDEEGLPTYEEALSL